MRLFDLSCKRWLFAFTHPDDEISICAWMRRLILSGADVFAGWSVTDSTRADEASAAMGQLGVPKENLFFHGMPDKGACGHFPQLIEDWRRVIEKTGPERIALGAFECGHIDHDATNYAVRKALERLGRTDIPMLEIPFYHTYLTRIPVINRFGDGAGQEILQLEPQEWKAKAKFSRGYASQNIGGHLIWYTALGWVKGRPPRLCRTERMRLQTHFDFTVPNLPEALRSKVMLSETWRKWKEAIENDGNENSE